MSSILEDVKKGIGPSVTYSVFDDELIMHINTVLFELNQLGVGPEEPFVVESSDDEWESFLGDKTVEAAKTYVILKCRMYFDPPTSGVLVNAINEQLKELTWRLNVAVDPKDV